MSDGNYLRVRGEYARDVPHIPPTAELPPRTRRILHSQNRFFRICGTTSAYAENTNQSKPGRTWYWNYLRVRGEYGTVFTIVHGHLELPPRTRRIHNNPITMGKLFGTTSAYAENTGRLCSSPLRWGNYLRVRGEYYTHAGVLPWVTELPPRTRRIP